MDDSAAIRFSGVRTGARARASLAVIAAALLAAGCAARPGTGIATLSTTVPESSALILPAPGTQSIVGVVQRQYTNAIEQQVALSASAATPGQNFISVQIFGPAETIARPQGALAYKAVSHSAVWAEMRRHVPGYPLAISSHFVRNNYGPFGYAYGPGAGGDGCLYGWQQIRSDAADRDIRGNHGMIQVRLRVCEAGASEKDLLALMYGYTIVGGFTGATWNPYGTPPAVDSDIGGGEPLTVALDDGGEPQPRRVSVRRAAATPVRAEETVTVADERATVAKDVVIVPSPSGTLGLPRETGGEAVVVPSPVCRTDGTGNTSCD